MPSKEHTLTEKIGTTVVDFVSMAIDALAERDQTRNQLFRPGGIANNQLVSKVRRGDLIDAMTARYPETRGYPKESLKRALSDKVKFLTDEEFKTGKKPK